MLHLASVVEGEGDVLALPIVLRRLLAEMEAWDAFAADTLGGRRGAILVVLDSDDDLPCELDPNLLRRAQNAASDIPTRVVLAHRGWEAWYRAAVASLAGRRGLLPNLRPPVDPEHRPRCQGLAYETYGSAKNVSANSGSGGLCCNLRSQCRSPGTFFREIMPRRPLPAR